MYVYAACTAQSKSLDSLVKMHNESDFSDLTDLSSDWHQKGRPASPVATQTNKSVLKKSNTNKPLILPLLRTHKHTSVILLEATPSSLLIIVNYSN